MSIERPYRTSYQQADPNSAARNQPSKPVRADRDDVQRKPRVAQRKDEIGNYVERV
jgi:hypothetical protein